MKRFMRYASLALALTALMSAAPALADETPVPLDEPEPTPYVVEIPELAETAADTYLIYVSKKTHTFAILARDEAGEYNRVVRTFITGLGKTSGMTRVGEFEITEKLVWKSWGAGDYSPYATAYSAGVWIHGPLYTARNFEKLEIASYNKIGTNCSHGCLRTTCEAAAWVFYNCPVGTKVIVANDDRFSAATHAHLESRAERRDPTDPGASPEVPITTFELDVSELSLEVGDTASISPLAIGPAGHSTQSFVYMASDPEVATVDGNGGIVAVGGGSAVITVTANDPLGMSRSVTVSVAEPTPVPVAAVTAAPAAPPTAAPEKDEEEVTVSVKLIQYLALSIVALSVAALGFAVSGCTKEPVPAATPVPVEASTPAPTSAPSPTSGTVDIALPTPTPEPTATPAPTPDPDGVYFASAPRDENNIIIGSFKFAEPADVMVMVTNDCVRVRSLPSTDGEIVTWGSLGQRMTATECVNGWLKVTMLPGMQEGYMRSDYVVEYDPKRIFYVADRRIRVNEEQEDGTVVQKVATLVDVRRNIPSIKVYMVLAYPDNAYGRTIYGRDICLLEKATCAKLARAQSLFLQDGYSIKLYDAYRPASASGVMYSIVRNATYVAPAGKSKHNRGVAVDMTLVDSEGNELEMPSAVMDLSPNASRSNPDMSDTARANMDYMTKIMRKAGFTSYSAEWWHFQDSNAEDYPVTDVHLVRSVTLVEYFRDDRIIDGGLQ